MISLLVFSAIGNAFSVLTDPAKRQRYDEFGIEDTSAPRRRQNGYEYDYTRGFEGMLATQTNIMSLFETSDHTVTPKSYNNSIRM